MLNHKCFQLLAIVILDLKVNLSRFLVCASASAYVSVREYGAHMWVCVHVRGRVLIAVG